MAAESQLGIATVSIRALMDDLDKDLSQARSKIEGATRQSTSVIQGVAKAAAIGIAATLAAVAVGVGAVTATLPRLIELGSDAEEMMGKFNTVFGDFAEGSIEDLDEMAKAMGRSKFEFRSFAASFQDTFVPLGFARGDAAELSKQLVELTADVASFNNETEANVARDFQSALVGNTETVRKYGIVITQAALDQELINMGIAEGVEGATEQEKVQARLNLIMAGTTDAQGDAIRTADSWANQMRALKSTISDTATEIGMALLPVFTPMLSRFRELAQEYGPQVAEFITTRLIPTLEVIGGRMADFAAQLKAAFDAEGLAGVIQLVGETIGDTWNEYVVPELERMAEEFWAWQNDPEAQAQAAAAGEEAGTAFVEAVGEILAAETPDMAETSFWDEFAAEVMSWSDWLFPPLAQRWTSGFLDSITSGFRINEAQWVQDLRGWFQRVMYSDVLGSIRNFIFGRFGASGGVPAWPTFAEGGEVPGPRGMPTLAVVHGGEWVIPPEDIMPASEAVSFGGRTEHVIRFDNVPAGIEQKPLEEIVERVMTRIYDDAVERMRQ